jgi:hypothetical protein
MDLRVTGRPHGLVVCLLKTPNCRENLEVLTTLPYHRRHDYDSVLRHFHSRLSVSWPRLPGARVDRAAASSGRVCVPRTSSLLIRRRNRVTSRDNVCTAILLSQAVGLASLCKCNSLLRRSPVRIAILGGAGAMGGIFGGWLQRAGNDLILVAISAASVEFINAHGL